MCLYWSTYVVNFFIDIMCPPCPQNVLLRQQLDCLSKSHTPYQHIHSKISLVCGSSLSERKHRAVCVCVWGGGGGGGKGALILFGCLFSAYLREGIRLWGGRVQSNV